MSMTEQLGAVSTIENGLSPEMAARFERIKALAKQNRRQYAIEKSKSVQSVRAAKPTRMKSKPSPKKARKPYFYNPAQRD
jgi:hypothetical protein